MREPGRYPNGRLPHGEHAQAFLSRGLEEFVEEREGRQPISAGDGNAAEKDFDLVIVGSGYGAAMAAATFAGRQVPAAEAGGIPRTARVALLERGSERLPGSFP